MSLNKKIHNLEEKVLNPIEWGSSKIALENEAEIALHAEAMRILTRVSNDYTPNEKFIIQQIGHIVYSRVIDVFLTVMKTAICHDDKIAFWMFLNWFNWFMEESARGIEQFLEENRIYDQKGKTWKQKEAEADVFYKTCRKPFTYESFEQHIKKRVNKK